MSHKLVNSQNVDSVSHAVDSHRVGKPSAEERDGWAERILDVCKELGFYVSPRKQGLRQLTAKLGQKGGGQLSRIVNWRGYERKGKAVALSRPLAAQIANITGFRAEWLLFGTPPRRANEAPTPVSARGEVLDLIEKMHGPVQPGVLSEYLRSRMRERLRSGADLSAFADELAGGKKSAALRRAVVTVWMGEPIAESAIPQWLTVLQRCGVSPITINTWWERNGRLLGPFLKELTQDPSPRGRGIAKARVESGVSDDAILAVLEAGALSESASESDWDAFVVNAHKKIKQGVQRSISTMRPRKKTTAKTAAAPKAPPSTRAPKSIRKTANEE